jgi:RNA binding exosome subunit
MEILSIKIIANSNATESVFQVQSCFSFLFPQMDLTFLTKHSVLGGYGNSIINFEYISVDPIKNHNFLSYIATHLSIVEKNQLLDELEKRTDSKGVLHLRFSKRGLAQQKIQLSTQSDAFHIAIKFSLRSHRFDIKKNYRELKEFLTGLGIISS